MTQERLIVMCVLLVKSSLFNTNLGMISTDQSAWKQCHSTLHSHPATFVTHLHETSRMSAEFVFRYGPKCMGGVILPILVLLHL